MSRKYDFFERVDDLLDMVDGGHDLVGTVVVDQAYAQIQHERLDFNHPRGGQAKYLEEPFLAQYRKFLLSVSRSVLKDGGVNGMAQAMESLSDAVERYAPVDIGNLRKSGHPMVNSGSKVVYDRPPKAERLAGSDL